MPNTCLLLTGEECEACRKGTPPCKIELQLEADQHTESR